MTAHERDMLWTDAREVELARDQRRELDHRVIDDHDDQPVHLRWAQLLGKVRASRKDPAAVRFVGDEPKRAVADRPEIPGRLPQARMRHAVQQMRG